TILYLKPKPKEVCGALPTFVPFKSTFPSRIVSFVSAFLVWNGVSPSYFQFPRLPNARNINSLEYLYFASYSNPLCTCEILVYLVKRSTCKIGSSEPSIACSNEPSKNRLLHLV